MPRKPNPDRANPERPAEAPEMPAGLSRGARLIWPDVVNALVKAGRCQPEDGPPIARYCESIALYRRVSREIERKGLLIPNARGGMQPNTLLTVRARLSAEQAAFEVAFGLNAKGRRQIPTTGGAKADALDDFMGQKHAKREEPATE